VTVGVVGTFAAGWLLPRLQEFHKSHPHVDLRVLTNNNRVDIAGEGLDFAIRFGDGLWHGTEATHLLSAPLSPLCSPKIGKRLRKPDALAKEVLLRSYRDEEWRSWFAAARTTCPPIRGPIFDSSIVMAHAAARGDGIALLPVRMFALEIRDKRLMQPFRTEIAAGDYWLTALKSKRQTTGMQAFKTWLLKACAAK
jgi:LysR family transcriptional regulator of beta-lactamase